MFKAKVICLGKYKEKAFMELEKEYVKRLRSYCRLEIEELKEVPYKTSGEIERAKLAEAELIIKRLPKDAVVILLEERGILRNSLEFSEYLERIAGFGRNITFVIGSGIGLHPLLRERANHIISLSPLTFTHNFARILLIEQIYRACTIAAGKEYHKD